MEHKRSGGGICDGDEGSRVIHPEASLLDFRTGKGEKIVKNRVISLKRKEGMSNVLESEMWGI